MNYLMGYDQETGPTPGFLWAAVKKSLPRKIRFYRSVKARRKVL